MGESSHSKRKVTKPARNSRVVHGDSFLEREPHVAAIGLHRDVAQEPESKLDTPKSDGNDPELGEKRYEQRLPSQAEDAPAERVLNVLQNCQVCTNVGDDICAHNEIAVDPAGVGSIVWADNVDIKVPVWCDIASRLQLFGVIIVPAGSLVVTRRLYLIAKMKPIHSLEPRQQRNERLIEYSLLLLLPALYVGIFYYTSQVSRFQVFEGYGCTHSIESAGMSILLLDLPPLIPPAIATLFYCPRILWVFYTQRQAFNRYLKASSSASSEPTNNYMRLLAIGCFDIVITLPVQAIGVVLDSRSSDPFIFYPGWSVVHADWTPLQVTREEWRASGWATFTLYFTLWANVALSFAIFGLYGLTSEALEVYKRGLTSVSRRLGRAPDAGKNPATSALVIRPERKGSAADSVDVARDIDIQAYKRAEAGVRPGTGIAKDERAEAKIETL